MIPGCVNIVRSSRGRGQSSGYFKSLVGPKWTPWQSVKCGISWILVAESLQKEAPLSVGLQARQVLRPPRVAFLRRPQAFVCHPTCFSAFSSLEKLHGSSPHPPNLKAPRRRTGMAGKILALKGTSGSFFSHFHQWNLESPRCLCSCQCRVVFVVLASSLNMHLVRRWAVAILFCSWFLFLTQRNIVYQIELFYLPKKCLLSRVNG